LVILNERGKVSESVSSNIFLVRDGIVVTPEGTASLLEGITRATIISLLRELGIPCVEREVDLTELYDSDEAFLSSTGLEILPLASVDGIAIGGGRPGEITMAISRHYESLVRGQMPDFPEWRTPVYGLWNEQELRSA
jgi:branched-chain amino acid aminotransferase